MKATIKLIPITEVTDGMQVYWLGCPSKVKVWYVLEVKGDWVECCPIYQKLNPIRSQLAKASELKIIVVEYKPTSWDAKQLPLKHSHWQQAIDDGLVDSCKEVEVEIKSEIRTLGSVKNNDGMILSIRINLNF
jgi:hypothetical protein